MTYSPPFEITQPIFESVARISELVGRLSADHFSDTFTPQLRRANTIKTVQASCAIEGNELTEEQVTAIFEGKTVLGAPREIQEVKNALDLYEGIENYTAHSRDSVLLAHKTLMLGLLTDAGQFRKGGVGIQKGDELMHLAPPAENVPPLMNDLLKWLEVSEIHPLITSSVFHYEFEFIHPFSDGNGRMGRFWQTLVLKQWNPLFAYVPIETVVRNNQERYYQALNESNSVGKSTPFVEFILETIETALKEVATTPVPKKVPRNVPKNRLEQVFELIRENSEITSAQIAELLGVSDKTIKRDISKLKSENRIERLGSLKAGHWKIITE